MRWFGAIEVNYMCPLGRYDAGTSYGLVSSGNYNEVDARCRFMTTKFAGNLSFMAFQRCPSAAES